MSVRDIDELKEEISIEAVLEAAGARWSHDAGEHAVFFCPFHLNENTPAGSMNRMKGVFYCFACETGGSIIDAALAHLNTTSIKEACDWLESEFLDG